MKSKRTSIKITDFSGGLNTLPPQTDVDPKYSPDCLNVYAEGSALRQRDGISKLNSSSAGTSGNGIYNWVLSASLQYLMGFFDNTLKQMTISGNTWGGTWATISANSGGTPFSNAIMHFVTYQGTLIMTTENRDKVQRMTPTDTTYKNIESGGTGISPLAKYPQVWKEHVWLLNIGGGGQITENFITLNSWTTLDVTTGISVTTTFGGLQTVRLHAGAGAGSDAHIKITSNITSMTTSFSAEIKTYFTSVGTIASGDYAEMNIRNGAIAFRTRWSADGLQVFSGGTVWPTIGVGLVTTGTWATWKFLVTAATATAAMVDVYKENSVAGLQFNVANATTASNGQIDLTGLAGGTGARTDWYIDYLYLNPIAVRQNYYTDGDFATWVGTTQATFTDNVLPLTSLVHFKCNDNAGNSTVANNGSSTNAGAINASGTTINSNLVSVVGKITSAFTLVQASNHNVSMNATDVATIKSDTTGSICLWVNPTLSAGGGSLVSAWRATGGFGVQFNIGTYGLNVAIDNSTANVLTATALVANTFDGTWKHIVVAQNSGGPIIYVNGGTVSVNYVVSTSVGAWLATLPSITNFLIGARNNGGAYDNSFGGSVDDIRYYRTSITSSNVQALYAEGNGNEGQPVTVQEGTTFYLGTYSYRVNNDGTYAVVSQTLSSSTAISGQSLALGMWFFGTNLATYKLRVNDGTNNYDSATLIANGTWQYQSLLFTPVAGATSVRAQAIGLSSSTFYLDQVAVVSNDISGSTQDFSDRLQRSVSGTYDTWTGGDSGTNDITTPGDVGLTGSFILQDRMYIMKSWNIYRITYTASTPLLDIKQARSVVGSKSPRSIKNIDLPDLGEVVIFLGTDRNLYLFDGFASTLLSDIVQINNAMTQMYMNNINTQAFDTVFGVNHSDLGFYEIFLPIGSSSVPNFSLIYNYRSKAFWPNDNRNFLSGDVSDDGTGQRVVMVAGATNGIAYQLNVGTSDDGTAINSYWQSFKLGEDYILGKDDEIRIACDAVAATPVFKWRQDYETTWTSKTLAASSNSFVYNPARNCNLLQFYIGNNSTSASFKFWHVKVLERGLGIGS